MKLICVDRVMPGRSNMYYRDLTIGKIYETIPVRNIDPENESTSQYFIMDDVGFKSWHLKCNFKPLTEYRQEQLDKIGI